MFFVVFFLVGPRMGEMIQAISGLYPYPYNSHLLIQHHSINLWKMTIPGLCIKDVNMLQVKITFTSMRSYL